MAKNKHLTYQERIMIEDSLREGMSFRQIAERIGKDPSTISKEIRSHFKVVKKGTHNPCAHRKECRHLSDICDPCRSNWAQSCKKCVIPCYEHCPDFEVKECLRLLRPPYVCNGCKTRYGCKLQRHLYEARYAQAEYEAVRKESREGFAISKTELERLDSIISPLIRQGQSVHQICVNNADLIMRDEKTIYNYIDAGLFSVRNIDLPRKVRYRTRKKKRDVKVDKQCYLGRTYADFQEFLTANPDIPVVEMDSVEGRKGGKVLLTIYFRSCSFMLAYIRDCNTARSVKEIFDDIYEELGRQKFMELFPVILTDRGSEFTDPLSLEFDREGKRRTRVFYCDPMRSEQKGGCEVTHEFIRRIRPKGSTLDDLVQADVSLMMSHINSYKRKKLNDRSSLQLFSLLYGSRTPAKLNISSVAPDEINLTPVLLRK